MNQFFKKQITLLTILCFFNATTGYSYSNSFSNICLYEENNHIQYLPKIENSHKDIQKRIKISLFTPYYIGKMCIYAYRFKKLKNSDIKGHIKLTKKCKKYAKKLGFKIRVRDYIDDICESLEEETGYSMAKVNKDLKKNFRHKSKKRRKSECNKKDDFEDDIDFKNIVEKSIMEIVTIKGEITLEEYIECLQMDPEININDITGPQTDSQDFKHTSSINHCFYGKGNSAQNQPKNLDFELSCYITLACVGGFLYLIPIPPINVIGGFMLTTGSTGAGSLIFHEYCEKSDCSLA